MLCSGTINCIKFKTFCHDYPIVLAPAFEFQSYLRKSTLGINQWSKYIEKRNQICPPTVADIKHFFVSRLIRNRTLKIC